MDTLIQRAARYLGYEELTREAYNAAQQLLKVLWPDHEIMSYEEAMEADVPKIILEEVCLAWNTTPAAIMVKSRKEEVREARQVFHYMIMELMFYGPVKPCHKRPLDDIAAMSGHDRCTMYASHDKVVDFVKLYPTWRGTVIPLKEGILKKLATFGLLVKGA